MNNERLRLIYLALISGHEGKMNWYKLDRSLRLEKINTDNLMDILAELTQAELISRIKVESSGDENFAITAKGQALLHAHKRKVEGDLSK